MICFVISSAEKTLYAISYFNPSKDTQLINSQIEILWVFFKIWFRLFDNHHGDLPSEVPLIYPDRDNHSPRVGGVHGNPKTIRATPPRMWGHRPTKGLKQTRPMDWTWFFTKKSRKKWRYVEMINSNLGGVSASDVNRRQRSIHKDGHMENAAKPSQI